MKRRNGFTLIETLLVVVIMGLVTLMALPKINSAFAHTNVINAKSRLVALYSTARSAAMSLNQTAILRLNGNQVYVYARPRRKAPTAGNSVDTIVRPTNFSTVYGVTVSGGADSVRIASRWIRRSTRRRRTARRSRRGWGSWRCRRSTRPSRTPT